MINQVEGVIDLGENEEQKKAIEIALLGQRVNQLEQWKSAHEEAQTQRMERLEEDTNKKIERIEATISKFIEKIDAQKANWMKNPPWALVILITSLCTVTGSLIVYLVTHH